MNDLEKISNEVRALSGCFRTVVQYSNKRLKLVPIGTYDYKFEGFAVATRQDDGYHRKVTFSSPEGDQTFVELTDEMLGKVSFLWPMDESPTCPVLGIEPDLVLVSEDLVMVGVVYL